MERGVAAVLTPGASADDVVATIQRVIDGRTGSP
jgi:hypothetical protein